MREAADCVAAAAGQHGPAVLDRRKKLEAASRAALCWQRWEMSTFDYLMRLNTLAGRTYNDLNQYVKD